MTKLKGEKLVMPEEFWNELTTLSIKWGGGDMHIMQELGDWFAKWAMVFTLNQGRKLMEHEDEKNP